MQTPQEQHLTGKKKKSKWISHREGRQSCVFPLAMKNAVDTVKPWEGAFQAILKEEWWSFMLPCNQTPLK